MNNLSLFLTYVYEYYSLHEKKKNVSNLNREYIGLFSEDVSDTDLT